MLLLLPRLMIPRETEDRSVSTSEVMDSYLRVVFHFKGVLVDKLSRFEILDTLEVCATGIMFERG